MFNKLFLTESKNSKRADKQTMQLIAQRSGWDINDERVLQTQRYFRSTYFGSEGVNVDWFIVLEPNFCAAAIDKGLLRSDDVYSNEVYNDLLDLIKYAYRKAKGLIETKGREAMLQYITELRENVVGWDTLYEVVGKALENERQEAMEKANQVQESESEYEVIGPVEFNEASEYGDYTAYQDGGEICYTQGGRTWNSYTHNDEYAVYILVKPNWDELEPVHDDEDEESAYDTYGMSMIFVIVDENGNLKTCNTRWNHEANYKPDYDVDFALDETELSELVGRPFSEVFKPKTPLTFEERVERILELINDFDNGLEDDIENLFDRYGDGGDADKVKIGDKSNFLIYDTDRGCYHFASEQWFDSVGLYYKLDEDGEFGLGNVYIEGLGYNYVKNDGTYLFDEWLQGADFFKGNHSVILKGGQIYITDRYGNLYNNKEEVFSEIANIAKNGGNILEQVDTCQYCGDNYYKVVLFDKENILFNGRLLSPDLWFQQVFITDNSIAARRFPVLYSEKNGVFQCNYLKTEGGLLLANWVEKAFSFKYTYHFFAKIEDNGETYYIDINGNKISE